MSDISVRKGDDMQIKASGGKQSKAFHSRSLFIHRYPSAQSVRRHRVGQMTRKYAEKSMALLVLLFGMIFGH